MKEVENGLIPVYEDEKGNQLVDGRRLHEFLKIEKDFSTWMKDQLKNTDALKEKDYTTLKGNCSTARPRAPIEYILTIEIAKEISMIAGIAPRSNKETRKLSKQARRYFISVEEKYKKLKDQRIKELENMVNIKLSDIDNRVKTLEDTKTIDYTKQLALQNLGKSKVVKALGGINSPAYRDKHIRSKTFFSIWNEYKNKFAVNSYRNTAVKDFEAGRDYLTMWKPSRKLAAQIQMKNGQTVIHI